VPELERLGRTISAWEDQALAYFSTGGVSNDPAEALPAREAHQARRV